MPERHVEPASALVGHIAVPGDKSISHRAVLIGAISEGETRIRGFGRSGDTEATVHAVRALGVPLEEVAVDELRVDGVGLRGLKAPADSIDCGNAGTLIRLLPGLLAGQEGRFELTGDESLRGRPVERIAEPLRLMGASVETDGGRPPLTVEGGRALRGIRHEPDVASAQVKSCLLLAGLYAEGRTLVAEPAPTRNHTEVLLAAAGARVQRRGRTVSIGPVEELRLGEVAVPGDFSSAAPFIVAATLLSGSELTIHDVGLNPSRTRFLDVLARMGAHVTVFNHRHGAEPVADLDIRPAELVATTIKSDEAPLLVDELPLFAFAAACARGTSVVYGAADLRRKESDRIETVATALRALGVRITATDDGWRIRGVPARPQGGTIDAAGDHRIAMLGAVAGLVSRDGVRLRGGESVAVSFPEFFELVDSVARRS